MLESLKHGDSSFVTLTYDDEHIPEGGNLRPEDVRDWLKRLRKVLSPEKIRFYLAGEYGPQTLRPHYHAAVFGLPQLVGGGSDGEGGVVADTWRKGWTFVGDLTLDSAQYVAGYVVEKLNERKDVRLRGRVPSFARMSLRPGIGAPAVGDVSRSLAESVAGLDDVARAEDVPHSLRHGKKDLPLGRYLRRELRGALGFASKDTPEGAKRAYALGLRELLKEAQLSSENEAKSVGKIFVDMNAQKRLNLESRVKIFSARRKI